MIVVRYDELIGPTSAVATYATRETIENYAVDATSSSTAASVTQILVGS